MNTSERAAGPAGTGTTAQGCPFGTGPCRKPGRHNHPYPVGEYGVRRCSCGSRHYVVVTGGPLPARIVCERCRKENYSATCYEAGRARGPRTVETADAGPQF